MRHCYLKWVGRYLAWIRVRAAKICDGVNPGLLLTKLADQSSTPSINAMSVGLRSAFPDAALDLK
jgi:hypothetical protein